METRTWTQELVKETMNKMGMQGSEKVTEENFRDFAKKIRKLERSVKPGETIAVSKQTLTENPKTAGDFRVYVIVNNVIMEQHGRLTFDEAFKDYQSMKKEGKDVILSKYMPGAEKIWHDEKKIFF